jgi:hypothetical protein
MHVCGWMDAPSHHVLSGGGGAGGGGGGPMQELQPRCDPSVLFCATSTPPLSLSVVKAIGLLLFGTALFWSLHTVSMGCGMRAGAGVDRSHIFGQ